MVACPPLPPPSCAAHDWPQIRYLGLASTGPPKCLEYVGTAPNVALTMNNCVGCVGGAGGAGPVPSIQQFSFLEAGGPSNTPIVKPRHAGHLCADGGTGGQNVGVPQQACAPAACQTFRITRSPAT